MHVFEIVKNWNDRGLTISLLFYHAIGRRICIQDRRVPMRLLGTHGWASAQALSLLRTTTSLLSKASFIVGPRRSFAWTENGFLILPRHVYSTTTVVRMNTCRMVNTLESTLDWSDRIGLQDRFTLEEKGWHVDVDWRPTPFGAGLFSKQAISKGTILRTGILGVNLKEFRTIADIDAFCKQQEEVDNGSNSIETRREYVKDYLWGFSKFADESGYPLDVSADDADNSGRRRFFGMWIPGNGLNHNTVPNTVYQLSSQGINLVALTDIGVDDELFDDYRRHGTAPEWLKEFAQLHNVTLNFADCNEFVERQ